MILFETVLFCLCLCFFVLSIAANFVDKEREYHKKHGLLWTVISLNVGEVRVSMLFGMPVCDL